MVKFYFSMKTIDEKTNYKAIAKRIIANNFIIK